MSRDDDEHERLRAEADRVRLALLRTTGELDRRAHRALAVAKELPHDPEVVGAVAAAAMASVGLAIAITAYRAAEAPHRRRQARRRWLADVWQHPDRARRSMRGSILEEVARSVAISLLAAAVAIPVRRAKATIRPSLLPSSRPPERARGMQGQARHGENTEWSRDAACGRAPALGPTHRGATAVTRAGNRALREAKREARDVAQRLMGPRGTRGERALLGAAVLGTAALGTAMVIERREVADLVSDGLDRTARLGRALAVATGASGAGPSTFASFRAPDSRRA